MCWVLGRPTTINVERMADSLLHGAVICSCVNFQGAFCPFLLPLWLNNMLSWPNTCPMRQEQARPQCRYDWHFLALAKGPKN